MEKATMLCYTKCSTCKKAENWLKAKNIEFSTRPIVEQKPTKTELKNWLNASNLEISKLFNTSGKLYKEQNIKNNVKNTSEDELLSILASDGKMVKRPILIYKNKVLFGFKEEEWNTLFEINT